MTGLLDNVMSQQGDLFGKVPISAHRDVMAICESCHREIQIVKYNPKTKEVRSEYRSAAGLCYSCAFPKRGRA